MTSALGTPEARARSTIRPALRCVLAVFLVLPYAHLGMLIAAAVHEAVGHGLVALAVGGGFQGFELKLDGMGRAYVTFPLHAQAWQYKAINAGGVASTTMGGIVLLLLSWSGRRLPWLALPLFAVATNQLLEGPPYLFWNAVHPVAPGDIAALVSGSLLARAGCIAIGGCLMVAAIWCTTALLMWVTESWLNRGRRLEGWPRVIALLAIGLAPGLAWFVFDWDQLVPGLEAWPNIVGLLLHLLAAASILPVHWRTEAVEPTLRWTLVSAAVGWTGTCLATIAVVRWLRYGVTW